MRRLFGGLCYVAFACTIASYMVGFGTDVQAEVHQISTVDSTSSQQNWTEERKAAKAASLEVVTMQGCDPCRRIKIVVAELTAEGYDIVLVPREKDTRGTTKFPTLYYLDFRGGLIRSEIGFKTAEHIKEYLGK